MQTHEKIKSAKTFLQSLENEENTLSLMLERIDAETLLLINEYSKHINDAKKEIKINEDNVYSCAIIIGFLLKGHIDRYELNNTFHLH